MDSTVVFVAGLVFVAVLAMGLALRSALAAPQNVVRERVRRVTQVAVAAATQEVAAPAASLWAKLLKPFSTIARPKDGEELSGFRNKLMYAGFRGERALEVFFGSKIALSLVLASSVLAASALRAEGIPRARLIAVVLTAVGFYAPNVWLRRRVTQRQSALARSLPDTLDLLVTCVEAGLSLDAALLRITGEIGASAPELSGELRLTTMEIQAGVVRADAFRRLASRTGLEELRSLSAMVIQTEMFGTGVARALRVHSNAMRIRRTHRAEEAAATVAIKMMVPLILCVLPSLFTIIMGPAAVRIAHNLMPAMAKQ